MAALAGNASGLSKAEYLKRYLDGRGSGGEDGAAKKKRRKKKRPEGRGMRIVDDDADDWKKPPETKEEVVEEEEDEPVVAEFVDERPEEVKRMEEFRNTNKWRRIQDDQSPEASRSPDTESRTKLDAPDSPNASSPQRSKHGSPDSSPPRKERHDSPDSSSPRKGRHDSPDASPPRKGRHDSPDTSPPRKGRHESPDTSPPRKGRHDSPDSSPPRKGRRDSPDSSMSKKSKHASPDSTMQKKVRRGSPDLSPPRKGRRGSPDLSPPRKGRRGSPDLSPPRKGRRGSPDLSPPRKGRRGSPDLSPPRKGRRGSPDLSPPRKGRRGSPDLSPPRKGRRGSPNPSPPRKRQQDGLRQSPSRVSRNDYQTNSPLRSNSKKQPHSPSPPPSRNRHGSLPPKKGRDKISSVDKGSTSKRPGRSSPYSSARHDSDSDLSPPRKMEKKFTQNKQRKVQHRDSDSDLSPPRHGQRRGSDSDLSPPRRTDRGDSDISPPRRRAETEGGPSSSQTSVGTKMLSGGRAGLVPAEILRKEKEEERRTQKGNKHLEQDSRNAETVFRDKSGKRRDLITERDEQLQKQAKQDKRDEMYAQWGKGLAQQEQRRQNMEDTAREMSKPLARYIDDADLDQLLREQERDGDPMAKFLKKKKDKEQSDKKERPRYKGPNPPPNRFNILPGYRWDGVDRSNGFESKHFARISEKKAVQESAYKWSVEDM